MPGAPAIKVKEAILKYAVEHKNQKQCNAKKKIVNVRVAKNIND